MTLDITLYDSEWEVGDYMITGSHEDGYQVYEKLSPENVVYESNDFESCLVWIMNSWGSTRWKNM